MPNDPSSPPPAAGILRVLLACAALAGWVAFLAGPGRPAGSAIGSALRSAPLGLAAVFVFADRGFPLARGVLVAFPAFGVGLALAALSLWLPARAAGPPSPSDLALPAVAVALGVAVGLALRRGLLALLLLPFKLAIGGLAAGVLLAVLLFGALEKQPSVPGPGPAVPRQEDPAVVPGASLRLTEAQLNQLIARAWPAVRSERSRLAVALEAEGRLRVSSSTRVPWISRWLNAVASARVTVREGRLALGEPRLSLARFELPPAALRALAPLLAAAIQAERPVRRALPAIRELHVEPGTLVVEPAR